VLRGPLRHGDCGCQGARGARVQKVRFALGLSGSSYWLVKPRRVLGGLAIAELLAMAPWFSASAVAPTLARVWQLSAAGSAWLTISVQMGFVAGALISAIFTLADRLAAPRLGRGSSLRC